MSSELTTNFTGLEFVNPFVLASAPPTESKRKILKAFESGWGGVVTKTIGLHPVENVAGPKTIFQRTSDVKPYVSRSKRPDTVSHSSWNWELISDQPLEQWLPDLEEIKTTYPDRMLIASIMAGASRTSATSCRQTNGAKPKSTAKKPPMNSNVDTATLSPAGDPRWRSTLATPCIR